MATASAARKKPADPRNRKGQWVTGVSGNPSGRPRKTAEPPKSFGEHLEAAMNETVAIIDARGKRRMVPVAQAVALELVHSLPTLKGRELVAAVQFVEKQIAADKARRPQSGAEHLTGEQARERLILRLEQLKLLKPGARSE